MISVPIVIWGSTFVLRIVERHPSVVYLGAGVLAWTAGKTLPLEQVIAFALERPWQMITQPLTPSIGAPPYSE